MDDARGTTYRFGPLERGGFMLGLRVPQLVGFVIAGAIGIGFLNLGGFGGLFLAFVVLGFAAMVLMVPLRGHTLEEWAPLTVRFLVGRWSKQTRFRAQLGQVGHVLGIPEGGLEPEEPEEPEDPKSSPSELAGIELLEGEMVAYDDARMGVIVERKARTYTAILACQGQAFGLLGEREQERRLADYGGVLAALARDDSPLRRLAWVERTLPADRDELAAYVMAAKREDATLEDPPDELVSYFQLLGRAPEVAEDHELLFVIQVDAMRASARRAIKRFGGGDVGAMTLLATEVSQCVDLLEGAGVTVTGILTRRGAASAIRNGYDPWGRQERQRSAGDGLPETAAGPMAREEEWSHLAADGALHCTMWVAEWPRIDVRALFLQPLLMETQTTRTVSMVMELVGPGRAMRQVERAATDAAADQAMRARIGQRTTQRQKLKEDSTERRERELADGHAEVRFAAYVTVSAQAGEGRGRGVDALEDAVSRVELQAKRAPLRLERMWGQQAEAFTFSLPLGRGLR